MIYISTHTSFYNTTLYTVNTPSQFYNESVSVKLVFHHYNVVRSNAGFLMKVTLTSYDIYVVPKAPTNIQISKGKYIQNIDVFS